MSPAVVEEPRVVHALPGRVRVRLPGWDGRGARRMETRLRELDGVSDARANPLTGSVLIRFAPLVTDQENIFSAALSLEPESGVEDEPEPPPVRRERREGRGRARIPVRGLDLNPDLARRVVERLESWPTVRAGANPLTGRVLVEFDEDAVRFEDLAAEVARVEPPEVSDEERPADPLDPAPLIKSTTRVAGAALGLGLLGLTRGRPVGTPVPAVAAGVIGLLEGFPALRERTRRLLGPDAADLFFGAANVAFLTLSGGSLGLAIAGLGAVQLLLEARARRDAWREYEGSAGPPAQPGSVTRLEAGERVPLAAEVIEGRGNAVGLDGLPLPVSPGVEVAAGSKLHGGPFMLELHGGEPFSPHPRPAPVDGGLLGRYLQGAGLTGFVYAAVTALLTRSPARTFAALLLVNPRAAIMGAEAAGAGASVRALRSGVTVVGTRPERGIRLPGTLLIDGPRVLTDGFEVADARSLEERLDSAELLSLAAGVAAAAGSPWGDAFRVTAPKQAVDGGFDGWAATARIEDTWYSLRPVEEGDSASATPLRDRGGDQGGYTLALCEGDGERPVGKITLRPRLAPGVAQLVDACRSHGVEVGLLPDGDPSATREVARRAGAPLLSGGDAAVAVRERQRSGKTVAVVSDGARAGAAFAACDLAVGLTEDGPFPARADLLAPDMEAVAAVVEAGARREKAVRDSVLFSAAAGVAGAVWGLRGPGVERAAYPVSVASLGALAAGWLRMRGGERRGLSVSRVEDPRPERWGRRSVEEVLRNFDATEEGLTTQAAQERRRVSPPVQERNRFFGALLDQIRSPITGILAAGAGLSLVLGAPGDVAMISTMIAANAVAGAWQERQADRTAEALERMGAVTAHVLRDGAFAELPAEEVVPGDVLLLSPGGRIPADARLLEAQGLEVDEAALTGESMPVPKGPDAGADESRVVLEGSDVTAGSGRAVVVAVGRDTRMGAIAAALATEDVESSTLAKRLNLILRQALPVIAAGGVIVAAGGVLRGRSPLTQLALGASVAIAAVPEGLPLLSKVGEAAVARRLAGRSALVRRLSAIEALGRVDVACADKTGTLTEGRLVLDLVADPDREASPSGTMPGSLRDVLLTAALANPRPDVPGMSMNRTDAVVVQAARDAGLGEELDVEREAELQFRSEQGFHASVVRGRLCVEGSAEALVSRCSTVRRRGGDYPLDEDGRRELLRRSRSLAERGLRVLMVAEDASGVSVDDPRSLTALGFLGITDPLRPGVAEAVGRCREAGVQVVMLTGDHPATASAIASEAGLPHDGQEVLTGPEMAELDDEDLDRRLENTTVIARVTPLDKLRIVESLQRRGRVVAMTGDGVNDGPALRLADVGVAMGRGGTEVARQAADVILADDDFSTLVETLVEGRGFWRNIRRALSLLLGGNLGELGLISGASILSSASPLTSAQVLSMNLITDVMPALAVALQQPEHRNLSDLAREGTSALERPLLDDVLGRAVSTATPSLAAYLLALRFSSLPQARAVAYACIIATQLAQTLDVGRSEGGLNRSVTGAVAGSTALFAATFAIRPLRVFLGMASPTPFGWSLAVAATLVAVALARLRPRPSLAAPPDADQTNPR